MDMANAGGGMNGFCGYALMSRHQFPFSNSVVVSSDKGQKN
jgi:hypothetical protein